jgi:hypothetical protein
MKRKEIIMMAKEAGFREDLFSGGPRKGKVSIFDFGDVDIFDNLERFAALVSAAERERAAKVCEAKDEFCANTINNGAGVGCLICADAIRALES